MCAAILFLAICVCDVMNKASLCGIGVSYITSQPFPALHWERVNQNGGNLRSSQSKQKVLLLHINIDSTFIHSLQMEIFVHFLRFQVN